MLGVLEVEKEFRPKTASLTGGIRWKLQSEYFLHVNGPKRQYVNCWTEKCRKKQLFS